MVKLFHISILYKHTNNDVKALKTASDLSSFGFFQRNSVAEFMNFTCKVLIERSDIPSRVSVKEKDYLCHAYLRSDRLCAVIISDQEYPHRVAHTLITKILDEFSTAIPSSSWLTLNENGAPFTGLDAYLAKYQNPKEADAMTKLQNDLDETKIILHNTITALLQRGEKLDELVEKSRDLSAQSKVFYKTARKTNQCCHLL
ncbi:synaptobrevin YKT6-like protein [Dinothrombium tinctorium]|uniref:Synaptobrevin YKT6-like protein n=1 Tax=Dinothrombium tinctorium TaxID=1965070 RepID=A0A3S3P9M1_9ACAR|nr:synaptobrevin YKT6-like protein [Dinothrombium tinctorium]RWS10814.1 synaptobrevin YKT6-like protein [Dinothrombium tinctorium]